MLPIREKKKAKVCKALLNEKEQEIHGHIDILAERKQEILVHEQNHLTLAETIKSVIAEFPPEVGQEDEDSTAKVIRLANIVQDLQQQVQELQAIQVSSTTLKELKEKRKATSEIVVKIKQGEATCTKALEDISTVQDALMEDTNAENIRVNRRVAEDKITTKKVDMNKLAFQEKVAKMTEIKQLQQEVQAL